MSQWRESKQISRAILRDQIARRKVMAWFVALLCFAIGLGIWGIDGFLESHLLLFSGYWFGVLIGAVLLILLCIYDMLMSLKN